MARKRWILAGVSSALVVALFLANSSSLATPLSGHPGVLAHRGIHQTFSSAGIGRYTCTATRIYPPSNPYLENTLPSMEASFAAGATSVELDVHPTIDGQFAVFHDWRLECRTNGQGVTRERSMTYLKTLDVGYGYTADGGRTYPFRGKGVGMMPTLGEVLRAFPSRRFLINIKSNDPTEADRLIAYLASLGVKANGNLWITAEKRPRDRLSQIAPGARVLSKQWLKSCSKAYLAVGWSGVVPQSCQGKFIAVPSNLTRLFWGWPNRLIQRMSAADVEVVLVGPVGRGGGVGLDDPQDLQAVPNGFPGVVHTDNVEVIGQVMKKLRPHPSVASPLPPSPMRRGNYPLNSGI